MIASTTIIHRPFGGLAGYRRVTDRACRVVVHAFPMAELAAVSNGGLLASPGTYILTNGSTAYIGESGRPSRRLADHAADPAKYFAREVYVVAGCDGSPFDKMLQMDFQFRLTNQAIDAGVVEVSKGANPIAPAITSSDRSTHDRIYQDALRLLLDAGCRIFQPAPPASTVAADLTKDEGGEAADSGPMSIGVSTAPNDAQFELRYVGLWARGYWAGERFIVAAGSEVRTRTNGSVNAITRTRREELFNAGVLAAIPGLEDRRRLVVAVAFPSTSIAAKVVCGAHTAGRWVALNPSKVWLAA